ncbi:MAG: MlaD family protein [Actinomycetota bacterium]
MKKLRTPINVATFMLASVALIIFGIQNFILTQKEGPKLAAEFSDAAGLAGRNDVTMRGLVVGTVDDVTLTETGVLVDMTLNPGTKVPGGTTAVIVRRSPIGELTLELEPGEGPPLDNGATIARDDTRPPPDVSKTLEVLADVLDAVPSDDLTTVLAELDKAVDERSSDLARFSEDAADLPERLLDIEGTLKNLIETGPELTGVFADNARVFADDLRQTALLADLLRDNRFELVDLNKEGARFLDVANDLIASEKANLACFIRDAGKVNRALVKRIDKVAKAIDTNHFFFDAVEQAVQKDQFGDTWFRVQLQPHTEPSGRQYAPKRAAPNVFPGKSCSSIYGDGVGAAQQGTIRLAPDSQLRR